MSSLFGGLFGGGSSGGLVGGVGGNVGDFPVSPFVADEGATVGERKVNNRTSGYLKSQFPGVAKAFKEEGEGARLGVFHVGEELLSRKTGEAGRYQALKSAYGMNPLAKVGVFKGGGTIGLENNILSGFGTNRPKIDLSGLNNSSRKGSFAPSKTINLQTTVISPDADSFRANQDQMNQDLMERLKRGI